MQSVFERQATLPVDNNAPDDPFPRGTPGAWTGTGTQVSPGAAAVLGDAVPSARVTSIELAAMVAARQ
ncbi:MAG: hypothetical protein ACRDZX_02675 [Acidimicrobiales bacterium]